eukprot:13345722-Ditylum_brightwellii.AAC.1
MPKANPAPTSIGRKSGLVYLEGTQECFLESAQASCFMSNLASQPNMPSTVTTNGSWESPSWQEELGTRLGE